MPCAVGKVTAFVIRHRADGPELLLIRHPHAGIQLPAGTMEEGETPEGAARREAAEETGLTGLELRRYLGDAVIATPEGVRIMAQTSRVFSRPDAASFDWASIRNGLRVKVLRAENGFTQVSYEETDRYPDPTYITYQITGWVPDEVLCESERRHFYLFECPFETAASWEVRTDNHRFILFWAPLAALPEIVEPQQKWLDFLRDAEGVLWTAQS
jgi:8-oxo-dGTP pyrophosphatase MutT (NUDIX family)